jgi:hypothetical protein
VQRSAQSLWQSAGEPRPLIVVCMGFNPATGKVEAFAANSEEGFEPQSLPAGEGHAMTPAPSIEDPDYPLLLRRWNNAAWGVGTQDFHRMAAQMMVRASRAAEGAVPAIGGMLRTAIVTGAGIGRATWTSRRRRPHDFGLCLVRRADRAADRWREAEALLLDTAPPGLRACRPAVRRPARHDGQVVGS